MNHADEARLRRNDYPAWCAYIAPRWVDMLKRSDERHKRELWDKASSMLKAAIRSLAK